ncbi:phosphatidylinositol glycan anchor biosynthesis class G [Phyllostomus discolor]|uniref:Phosphatidylinositol glycan anchor biosynthesis class G n=1 Tax=Phyllostomus discolor TaxID=89673 RepID=A0A834EWQ5_9CHIR|nr:phosphatidylinositol glycan anchor biosynthesis class G [Phyllostomus discolor]
MLIDGLRDDFVFGSKGVKFMPYTTYLVEKGASHSFVAEAKPPTVTMPRIKLSLQSPPHSPRQEATVPKATATTGNPHGDDRLELSHFVTPSCNSVTTCVRPWVKGVPHCPRLP